MSHRLHEWVWRCKDDYMGESCPVYEWVMPHARWMSHVLSIFTRVTSYRLRDWVGRLMDESRPVYEWVILILVYESAMAHIWMSHVPYMNKPWHIYGWVVSCIYIGTVPCINESCHTYDERVKFHVFLNESCPTGCAIEFEGAGPLLPHFCVLNGTLIEKVAAVPTTRLEGCMINSWSGKVKYRCVRVWERGCES